MVGIIMDTADAGNTGGGVKTTTQWPSFQVTPPDPVLGKKEMSPEQTLIEFISTSAAFHGVKKQTLQTLEGDLLKVFLNNTMPANAAAWYMAKRKFYLAQPLDHQLLPFLLKKYPHKFSIRRNQVFFLEKYSKEVAKKKQQYLVQYGLNAYFSHKADEYGVYFFDPQYYENTEPFHESLRQTTGKLTAHRSKLVPEYFKMYPQQFKFTQHSAYLVSISKQPGVTVLTNTTGVIVSMVNNQYGFIKFGSSEKALFCAKSLFKDGWLYTGDPLRLPAMQFDGYQIPGDGSSEQYSWYAVLVWCGRKPSPKYCSTTTDLNSTSVFRTTGDESKEVVSQGKKLRQPSSSMMVGQVIEIKKNAAIVSVRDDSEEKVYVPGWKHEYHSRKGAKLTTLTGEIIGSRDLVAYYVDTNATKDGYHAVGKNVMVLKEYEEVESKKGRRRRLSTAVSGDSADYEPRRRNRDESDDSDEEESELDVTDSELEWLERDIESIIDTEPPEAKTLKLLAEVKNALVGARGNRRASVSKVKAPSPKVKASSPGPDDSGVDSRGPTPAPHGDYQPVSDQEKAFWRLKAALAALDEYDSEDDVDYRPGMDITQVQDSDHGQNSSMLSDSSGFLAHESLKPRRRNRLSSTTSVANDDQKYVPYWARAIRQPEVWCPHTNKFLVLDIGYREDADPDYAVPVTDDEELASDDGEEDADALKKEASEDVDKDLLDGKHRIIVKPPKIVITPVKDAKEDTDGENNPEDVGVSVEHETSDDKTDGEDGDAAKAKTGSLDKLWVREMSLAEQPEEYDSDADQEWIPPAVIYDTDCDYDEVEEVDAVISEEEVKLLLEEGLTEDKKNWKQTMEPGDLTLPPLMCGCQADKPEELEQEQADKRPMLPQPADSTGLTPALKKLKMSPETGDLAKNIKKLQLNDHENNKAEAKDPEVAKEKAKGSEVPKPKRDSPKKKSKGKTSDKEDGIESPGKEKSKEVKIPKAEKSKDVKGSPKEEKSKEAKSSPKTEKNKDAEKEVKSDEKKVTTGDLPKKEEGKPEGNGKAEKEAKKNGSSEKKKKVSK